MFLRLIFEMSLPAAFHLWRGAAMMMCGVMMGAASLALASEGLPRPAALAPGDVPEFNKHVRPVLSAHCFRCHGQDAKARKGDLRLDVREAALEAKALAPGQPEASPLWQRIVSEDPDEVMPPPGAHDGLSAEEKDVLRRWIAAGAEYAAHWSFIAPVKPPVPSPPAETGPRRDDLDAFVLDALAARGMKAAAPATREEWLRRVSFDLTGLPPTVEEQDAFLADLEPGAEERVADRLLASPAYGERMAADWLDVARYADTYGRHEDADCATWPYRDWLIRAFNQNLPYDQFILWQTAGDMLAEATKDQRIATAFNRLPQQSNEAGSDPEEFRIEQVADRVRTNGMAFLGLSIECARCHDHKYDPISMKEYYQLAAYFNNIRELGLFCVYTGGTPPPSMLLYTSEQQEKVDAAAAKLKNLEARLETEKAAAKGRYQAWLKTAHPPRQEPAKKSTWQKFTSLFSANPPPREAATKPLAFYKFEALGEAERDCPNEVNPEQKAHVRVSRVKVRKGKVGNGLQFTGDNSLKADGIPELHRFDAFSFGLWVKPLASSEREVIVHRSRAGIDAASRGLELIIDHDRLAFAVTHFWPGNEIRIRSKAKIPINEWTHVTVTYDGSSRAGGMHLYVNGRPADCDTLNDNLYRDIIYRADWGDDTAKDDGDIGFILVGRANDACYDNGFIDEFFFYDRELIAAEVAQRALLEDTSSLDDWLGWYVREKDEPCRKLAEEIKAVRAELNELSGLATDLMVMEEQPGPRRPTHVLARGQFNQPTEEVSPSVPAAIMPIDPALPPNRLGFAQWLLDPKHPLTTRVAVNRLWQQFFGRGLVATSEDFGTQGELPSHPELLDWLAVTFRESGWDVKAFCRRLVLSATYRQSGQPAALETLKDDPENRWLARGPRSRLSSESVRDLALAASGLLVRDLGGPSVKPYQPEGLWEQGGTQHTYVQDHGGKLYRRSLYTFWRRTMPPPSMLVFDSPTREFCVMRREPTATPLQSLVLMNDPQIIEAARVLAEELVRKFPQDDAARAREAFRRLASQQPRAEQLAALCAHLAEERAHAQAAPQEALELLRDNGERPRDETLPAEEVAATTLMVRLIFAFSETTMKP